MMVLALLAVVAGCGRSRDAVRAQGLPAEPPPSRTEYRIARGDVLSVRVWNQESMSIERTRVREDGKISVPFLQDIDVDGLTPAELSERLQAELKTYVVTPVVTVALEEARPLRISVVGHVVRAGTYDLDRGAGVLHALAAAGGLGDFADKERIYVLRSDHRGDTVASPPARIRFAYRSLTRGDGPAAAFRLRTGDVVVVE